jgi:hypothetical protein
MGTSTRTLIFTLLLGILLLFPFTLSINSASALQQIAGKIEVHLAPGESESVRWGLVSDSDEDLELKLISDGIGAEFLSIPATAPLAARETKYIDVVIAVPQDHPGGMMVRPYVQANQAGEPGQVVLNVGLRKYIDIVIEPNPDSSLRTLQMKSFENKVIIDGKEVVMTIESTSEVSNFVIEYEKKQISFVVSGHGGTNGSALVPVGLVLEGPYSVLIDDIPITTFETIDDSETTDIRLRYSHSDHKVTITGASVIPEFPIPILGMIAGLVVLIIAASPRIRTSLKFN